MVSRITVAMIQSNKTTIVENGDRFEIWTVKRGRLHALMVSCDEREELESWLAEIKSADEVYKIPEAVRTQIDRLIDGDKE
jgi:hypothetical protein